MEMWGRVCVGTPLPTQSLKSRYAPVCCFQVVGVPCLFLLCKLGALHGCNGGVTGVTLETLPLRLRYIILRWM